jgi:hypothetical protein
MTHTLTWLADALKTIGEALKVYAGEILLSA